MIIATIKKLDGTYLDHGNFKSQESALAWFRPFIDKGVYGQKHIPVQYRDIEVLISEAIKSQVELLDENQLSFDPPQFETVEVTPAVYETQQELVQEEIPAAFVIEFSIANNAQNGVEEQWNILRTKRTQFLIMTDWTQLADSPLSTAEKNEYRSYRGYLRVIPQLYDDATVFSAKVYSFEDWKKGNR